MKINIRIKKYVTLDNLNKCNNVKMLQWNWSDMPGKTYNFHYFTWEPGIDYEN